MSQHHRGSARRRLVAGAVHEVKISTGGPQGSVGLAPLTP